MVYWSRFQICRPRHHRHHRLQQPQILKTRNDGNGGLGQLPPPVLPHPLSIPWLLSRHPWDPEVICGKRLTVRNNIDDAVAAVGHATLIGGTARVEERWHRRGTPVHIKVHVVIDYYWLLSLPLKLVQYKFYSILIWIYDILIYIHPWSIL